MKNNQIRLVLVLGIISILGIISVQVYWLSKAFDIKERQFNETIHIALLNVAENVSSHYDGSLSNEDIVVQLSSDYFVVNINDVIDANVLEYYLTNEFKKLKIDLDFEYAIYDCGSDKMVYGKYVNFETGQSRSTTTGNLPTYDEYIYYFGVRFPTKSNFVIANIRLSLLFSIILSFAVLFFGYAMYVILQQKRLSELQTDFINNMTHEFKTPIASIGLSVEVLNKNEKIKEDGKLQNYLKIIKEQTDRLNNQVEKVLQIAKVQQNNLDLNKETINLVVLIETVKRSALLSYEKLNGRIEFEHSETQILINADKHHLTNILFNILDNSLKYNNKTPVARVSLKQEGKKVLLQVSDNGIGIDKKHLKHIFERFYRVPTGNVHNVKGFGLGLFYVKKIVDLHGWKISISSEKGAGTILTIQI
jgi:two-component system, OmpR family, phosphate regulon sensor histidine kinase PhoR